MSKTFDKIYNGGLYLNPCVNKYDDSDKNNAYQLWLACKKEVLKILNRNKITLYNIDNPNNDEDASDDYIAFDALTEIENL